LVDINLRKLSDYYSLVEQHAARSFITSIVAGSAGFALLTLGLLLGFFLKKSDTISYLTSGAGLITEFIAAIFFYLYNRTVRQLKEYHDSLLDVQNVFIAFRVVRSVKDDKQGEVTTKMLDFLMSNERKRKT
jgi:hypothetical protein